MQKKSQTQVVLVGNHHGEAVVPETLAEMIREFADREIKVAVLDEAKLDNINILLKINSSLAKSIYAKDFLALKEVYNKNGTYKLLERVDSSSLSYMQSEVVQTITNLDGMSAYKRFVEKIKKYKGVTYKYIDSDDIEHDIAYSLGRGYETFDEREVYMFTQVVNYVESLKEPELVIVSVGFLHVEPMRKMLQSKFDDLEITAKAFWKGEKAFENDLKGDSKRSIDEQKKDILPIKQLVAEAALRLSGDNKLTLNDLELKRFPASKDTKESVKQLMSLKKLQGINFTYDSNNKTFTVLYPENVKQEVNDVFSDSTFVKLVAESGKSILQL